MKYTEDSLEQAIVSLLQNEQLEYLPGADVRLGQYGNVGDSATAYGIPYGEEVLIEEHLRDYLLRAYREDGITQAEINRILLELRKLPASDLYESNRQIMKWVSDGFVFKRDDRSKKDLFIQLIDYSPADNNRYLVVNQLGIKGNDEVRIPDVIVYINGLPLVVWELKTATREEVTLFEAYDQLTNRYRRAIPELFKYNAFCVISDGVNTKAGSFFAAYDYYYAWRRNEGQPNEVDGVDSLYTLINGMFNRERLRDIIRHFIYFPDKSNHEVKVLCRYPQFYAARALYKNIVAQQRPEGSGKGGTYFGATGSGKSLTMLFLTRLLMRSTHFESPTIILITDRTDLDNQLSAQFQNAKGYIGDDMVISAESRAHLREQLQGRKSGGVFLTTIHKFTEDTQLLSERANIICISDEAHRSQVNLEQKVRVTNDSIKRTYGFAKYLHDSLPNATYVGFTGTPIDATLDVFGEVVDAYTMTESVEDEITVRIVYEGRAAKVALENSKLQEIEKFYEQCAKEGTNEYQIEESKRAVANMNVILGDPDRLQALAEDLIAHYDNRVAEGSTVLGKAMIVCANRTIAYDLYQKIMGIRPDWAVVQSAAPGVDLSEREQQEIKPMAFVNLIMTRNQDDPKELWEMLGTKEYKQELDRQFKNPKSNFKLAIVVDMWLTGFDVPFLDTMYIDKPIQRHTLIQTISRVNRKFPGKEKGLVVDYIGIKKQMNLALAQYNKADQQNFEDIQHSIGVVRDYLDLLDKLFHKFDSKLYFTGTPLQQLDTLNKASEFVQVTQEQEKKFMSHVKRLKAAYDIASGTGQFTQQERDKVHFYLAVRSIVYKLTKGTAPDIGQMNEKVRQMIKEALQSEGVEEIFKLGEDDTPEVDLFDEQYLNKLAKIKLPNTKIKLLQKLLSRAIDNFKKVNRMKGIDFSKKMLDLVDRYNNRKGDTLQSEVLEDFTNEIMGLIHQLKQEISSFEGLGIDLEEKAFYDILKELAHKYDFAYPEDKLLLLAAAVRNLVDDKSKYIDWNKRDDIKAELKANLIILLAEYNYPPIDRDEVYKEIFEQAENYKKNAGG